MTHVKARDTCLATFFVNEKAVGGSQLLWLLPRMMLIAVYSLIWYYFFHSSTIGIINNILVKPGFIDK